MEAPPSASMQGPAAPAVAQSPSLSARLPSGHSTVPADTSVSAREHSPAVAQVPSRHPPSTTPAAAPPPRASVRQPSASLRGQSPVLAAVPPLTGPHDAAPALPSTNPQISESAGIGQLENGIGSLTLRVAEPAESVAGARTRGRSAPATRSRARNTAAIGDIVAIAPIVGDTPEALVITPLRGGRRKRKPQ